MTRYDYEQQLDDERRHHEEHAERREVIHPVCTHTERANVLSLPSMGNPHMCRECWDLRFKGHIWTHTPKGHTYRNALCRDGEWRQEEV